MGVSDLIKSFFSSWRTSMHGGRVCFRWFLRVSWFLICWRRKDFEEKKDFNKYKKVKCMEHDALDWLARRKTFALGYVWYWIHKTQNTWRSLQRIDEKLGENGKLSKIRSKISNLRAELGRKFKKTKKIKNGQ